MGLFIAAAITTALALCGFAMLLQTRERLAAAGAGVRDRAAAAAADVLCCAAADRRLAAHHVRHRRLGDDRVAVLRAADRGAGQVAHGRGADGAAGDRQGPDLPRARRRRRLRHRRDLVPGACADQIAELSRSAVLDVRRLPDRAAGGLLPARRVAGAAVLRAGARPFVPARRARRNGAAFPAQFPDLSRPDQCCSASARTWKPLLLLWIASCCVVLGRDPGRSVAAAHGRALA